MRFPGSNETAHGLIRPRPRHVCPEIETPPDMRQDRSQYRGYSLERSVFPRIRPGASHTSEFGNETQRKMRRSPKSSKLHFQPRPGDFAGCRGSDECSRRDVQKGLLPAECRSANCRISSGGAAIGWRIQVSQFPEADLFYL